MALQTLTRQELAVALGCHPGSISKWQDAGMPVFVRGGRGKPSKYDEVVVRAWLQQREEAARRSGPLDPLQERAAREHAQRLLLEQTHQVRAKELLPADEVAQIWAAEIGAVRAKLLAWPLTLADQVYRVATLEGLPGVERVLHEAVYQALREIAEPHRPAPCPRCGLDLAGNRRRATKKRRSAAARRTR